MQILNHRAGLGWGLGPCVSYQCPGDADAAVSGKAWWVILGHVAV